MRLGLASCPGPYSSDYQMAKPRLTDARVTALEPRQSDYVEWCGNLPGFGCRVRPSGAKSLIIQYDFGGRKGVTRRITLGKFPTLGVELARKEGGKILAKVALGEDVAAERSTKRSALTMAELCDEYVTQGCGHKKASTIATDRGRIERHIKPLLGDKRITEIIKADLAKWVRDVANGATAADVKTGKRGRAIVTGGKGAATRRRGQIG
jgi:hypothetical protein